jgi:hypothetical protein
MSLMVSYDRNVGQQYVCHGEQNPVSSLLLLLLLHCFLQKVVTRKEFKQNEAQLDGT